MATPDNRLIFPGVSFGSERVGPPSPLYVTPDTFLFVRALCGTATQGISVHFRVMLPTGIVSSGRQDFATGAARTVVTQLFPLPEGYLLSVAVHPTSGTLVRGQCFVQVGLERGGAPDFEPMQALVSNYITTSSIIGWPGGILLSSLDGPGWVRAITGTSPAPGVEVNEVVPALARWRLLALKLQLTSNATAANREVILQFDDTVVSFAHIASTFTQLASTVVAYSYFRGGVVLLPTQGPDHGLPLPYMEIRAGWEFNTNTINLQAGDHYGAPFYLVEEWQEL